MGMIYSHMIRSREMDRGKVVLAGVGISLAVGVGIFLQIRRNRRNRVEKVPVGPIPEKMRALLKDTPSKSYRLVELDVPKPIGIYFESNYL